MTTRNTVHGVGVDNETGKQITEPDACRSGKYINEKPWDSDKDDSPKPVFRAFYHRYDVVNDPSCMEKAIALLRDHRYPEVPAFLLEGNARRGIRNHLWQDDYNQPLLEFFTAQLRPQLTP